MKRLFVILFLISSASASAHLHHHHDHETPKASKTWPETIWSVLGTFRHIGEIYSHGFNVAEEIKNGKVTSEILYHGTELVGHGFNIANYLDLASWKVSAALIAYNSWAATAQFKSIRGNIEANSCLSLIAALFGSLDFIGHVSDIFYATKTAYIAYNQPTP